MEEMEVEIHYEEEQGVRQHELPENGVEISIDRINQETLHTLIGEFVTREWDESGDACFTLDDKIEQVLRQLQEKKAMVVFDLTAQTANIVDCR